MPTPSQYLNTHFNQETGTFVVTPVATDGSGTKLTVMSSTATMEYKIDLPPGCYITEVTVSASITGTTTTIGSFKQFANSIQSRNCTQPMPLIQPAASTSVTSVTFPAGAMNKNMVLLPSTISASAAFNAIPIPFGIRFLVAKGTANAGERFEVVATAAKVA
jgi:hypothetical protein